MDKCKRAGGEEKPTAVALKELLKKDNEWCWESKHQSAFESIKVEITKTPILAYFDATKEHTIQSDGSQRGLGGVLLQDGKPVIYISRTLTPAESRYSNIERDRYYNYTYYIYPTNVYFSLEVIL